MTQIVEYSVTDANLKELAEKYSSVPDAVTDEGYQAIKECLRETTPLRTAVEKRRKELKKDALEYGRKIDTEAKRITSALVDIETPYREAKQVVDDAVAKAEQDKREAEENRIIAIQNRLKEMDNGNLAHVSMTVETLEKLADKVGDCFSFDWQEFADAAEVKRKEVTAHILSVITERKAFDAEQDKLTEERKAMQEKQAELDKQAEEQRKQQEAIEAERVEAARVMKEAQDKAEAEKRAAEQKKLAEERAEAEKVRKEKERLEAEKREAEEQQRKKEAAEADAIRQKELMPTKEKLRVWAEEIKNMEGPNVRGKNQIEIVNKAMADLGEIGNWIHAAVNNL